MKPLLFVLGKDETSFGENLFDDAQVSRGVFWENVG